VDEVSKIVNILNTEENSILDAPLPDTRLPAVGSMVGHRDHIGVPVSAKDKETEIFTAAMNSPTTGLRALKHRAAISQQQRESNEVFAKFIVAKEKAEEETSRTGTNQTPISGSEHDFQGFEEEDIALAQSRVDQNSEEQYCTGCMNACDECVGFWSCANCGESAYECECKENPHPPFSPPLSRRESEELERLNVNMSALQESLQHESLSEREEMFSPPRQMLKLPDFSSAGKNRAHNREESEDEAQDQSHKPPPISRLQFQDARENKLDSLVKSMATLSGEIKVIKDSFKPKKRQSERDREKRKQASREQQLNDSDNPEETNFKHSPKRASHLHTNRKSRSRSRSPRVKSVISTVSTPGQLDDSDFQSLVVNYKIRETGSIDQANEALAPDATDIKRKERSLLRKKHKAIMMLTKSVDKTLELEDVSRGLTWSKPSDRPVIDDDEDEEEPFIRNFLPQYLSQDIQKTEKAAFKKGTDGQSSVPIGLEALASTKKTYTSSFQPADDATFPQAQLSMDSIRPLLRTLGDKKWSKPKKVLVLESELQNWTAQGRTETHGIAMVEQLLRVVKHMLKKAKAVAKPGSMAWIQSQLGLDMLDRSSDVLHQLTLQALQTVLQKTLALRLSYVKELRISQEAKEKLRSATLRSSMVLPTAMVNEVIGEYEHTSTANASRNLDNTLQSLVDKKGGFKTTFRGGYKSNFNKNRGNFNNKNMSYNKGNFRGGYQKNFNNNPNNNSNQGYRDFGGPQNYRGRGRGAGRGRGNWNRGSGGRGGYRGYGGPRRNDRGGRHF
jgi:hypothetical protein